MAACEAWEAVGSGGASMGQADNTSLAFGNADVPYVAIKEGGFWETIASPRFSPGDATGKSSNLVP